MSMKAVKINSGLEGSFVMPAEILPLLPKTDGTLLRVLVYSFAKVEFELSAAAEEIGVTADEFENALSFWEKSGVFSLGKKDAPPKKPQSIIQSYDGETLSDAIQNEPDFAALKDTIEEMTGRLLNKNDINLLYNLFHFTGLGADYICTVAAYASRSGKTNLRYITNTALSLYDEGVDTFEKLEETLSAIQKKDDLRARFASLCGFGQRRLSPREEGFLTKWFIDFDLSFDLVKQAYEKMVDAIGTVKLAYLDKILTDWHSQGIKTAVAAKGAAKPKRLRPDDSFDISEFVDAALKRGVGGA